MSTTRKTGQEKLVICIEDEPELIGLIRLILGRAGYRVLGVSDGEAGLKMTREMQPDLVLLDLASSETDNWELYWQMKEDAELKDIPVVVVTVGSSFADRRHALESAKVDGYVVKPFRLEDLLLNVQRVFNASS
jgi:DNA-binding response OmpR family regulator